MDSTSFDGLQEGAFEERRHRWPRTSFVESLEIWSACSDPINHPSPLRAITWRAVDLNETKERRNNLKLQRHTYVTRRSLKTESRLSRE